MKRPYRYLPLLLFCSVPWAQAQFPRHHESDTPGPYNFAIGFGSASDTSNGSYIEGNPNSVDFGLTCTPSSFDTTCTRTPGLGGLFMGFEGDAMLNKRIGFGGELNFQPSKGAYGPLKFRQEFYDFNGLFTPLTNRHYTVRLEAGIGGAHTGTSYTQSTCVGAFCSNLTESFASANHFQEHVGAGIQVYLTHHLFIRPQFDYRHVQNFTQEFGRDSVLQGSVWLGYNFGEF